MTKLTSLDKITLPSPTGNEKIDLNKGFIVQVFEGNKVSILVDRLFGQGDSGARAGFFELNYRNGNLNTTSKDIEAALTRSLEDGKEGKVGLYYFDSLEDFAHAVLTNKWELY